MSIKKEPRSKLPLSIEADIAGDKLLKYNVIIEDKKFTYVEGYKRIGQPGLPNFLSDNEFYIDGQRKDIHPGERPKMFREVVAEIYNDFTNPKSKISNIKITVDGNQYDKGNYKLDELKDIFREVIKRATTKTTIDAEGNKTIAQRQFDGVNLDEIGSRKTPDSTIKITEKAQQAIKDIQQGYTPTL